ncbi:MAG TPA: hypothetical protein VH740_11555 [Vicinamibacterales bacterium]|jgi:hypothetical protein
MRRAPLLLLVAIAVGACDVNRALDEILEARHLAADLLVQFTKAADASNLAVMADTDEASVAFAKEASARTAAVQKDLDALKPLLEDLHFTEELRLLEEFRARFGEYQTLDGSVLGLAVENTNLKAQRLSFGAAQQAADALGQSLDPLEPSGDSKEAWQVKAIAATIVARAREIQSLEAPHIAEPDDAVMDRVEKRMSSAEAEARQGLAQLAKLVRPVSQPKVAAASAALDRLVDVNRQMVQLSRRNTNVRSLALSLYQKRPLIAACEESLDKLQQALAKRAYAKPGRFS